MTMPAQEVRWRVIFEEGSRAGGLDGNGRPADSADASPEQKVAKQELTETRKQGSSLLKIVGLLGLGGGIYTLIRQSTIANTYISSTMRILGYLVDVMLLPLVPLLTSVLKILISGVAIWRRLADEILTPLVRGIQVIASGIAWVLKKLHVESQVKSIAGAAGIGGLALLGIKAASWFAGKFGIGGGAGRGAGGVPAPGWLAAGGTFEKIFGSGTSGGVKFGLLTGALMAVGQIPAILRAQGEARTRLMGRAAGTLAGGVAGGVLGSLVGPGGTIVGSFIGAKLGGYIGEKIAGPIKSMGAEIGRARGATSITSAVVGGSIGGMLGPVGIFIGAFLGAKLGPLIEKHIVDPMTSFFQSMGSQIANLATASPGWVLDNIVNPITGFFGFVRYQIIGVYDKVWGWVDNHIVSPIAGFFEKIAKFISDLNPVDIIKKGGGWLSKILTPGLPGHQSGASYVAKDQLAFLHQGEAVLERGRAFQYRQGLGATGGNRSVVIHGDTINITVPYPIFPDVIEQMKRSNNRLMLRGIGLQ